MKCTWNSCGKETNKKCPIEWIKHKEFDPRTLHIFFAGTQYENKLNGLKAFVCSDCMYLYKAYLKRNDSSKQGAQKRKMNKKEDYSI